MEMQIPEMEMQMTNSFTAPGQHLPHSHGAWAASAASPAGNYSSPGLGLGGYTLKSLCEITGGRAVGAGELSFSRPAVDSRTVRTGQLFVALPGERADGHNFLQEAFAGGATVALVGETYAEAAGASLRPPKGRGYCVVPDTLRALQQLSRAHLQQFPLLRRIAVTGSNGKTTTKELIASVLSQNAPTFATAGNYNSEIGVPLAIFDIQPEQRFGVFEVAMNRPGEIAVLAELVQPEIALITNIGSAHVGNLGDLQRIAEEKRQVFSCFNGEQAGFVYEDERFYSFLTDGLHGEVHSFGPRSIEGFEGFELQGLTGSIISYQGLDIRLPLPGAFNVRNALAAVAIAVYLGLDPEQIRAGLERVPAMFGRGEILHGPVTVLRDCYNANPDSVREALDFVAGLDWSGRRVVVLGSMKELGDETASAHAKICAAARAMRPDALFLVGEEFAEAYAEACAETYAEGDVKPHHATTTAGIEASLSQYLREGDFVLLKGSRSMALEDLTSIFTQERRKGSS
ncbi:MAG: UDP-N-acetylmuramoyl-tripeptide--D-alanyl-D-alanine ligase [Spirochaetaceae bacterium]|nr:MAG: UDP-N-acetylmuramoyl-tripeptide--D-alanyl-D-alanine ligase [Spirochaetaceae bacterium]